MADGGDLLRSGSGARGQGQLSGLYEAGWLASLHLTSSIPLDDGG